MKLKQRQLTFKAILAIAGYNRTQLAKELDVNVNSVDRWLAGIAKPNADNLIMLAKLTGFEEAEIAAAIVRSKK